MDIKMIANLDKNKVCFNFNSFKDYRIITICLYSLTLSGIISVSICVYFLYCQANISRTLQTLASDNGQCKSNELCLRCDQLDSHLMGLFSVEKKMDKESCCIMDEQVPEFLKHVTKYQVDELLNNDQHLIVDLDNTSFPHAGTNRPLGHLAMESAIPDSASNRLLIHWAPPQDPRTFLKNGMALFKGRYVAVPSTGKYFIYSQITFLSDVLKEFSTCSHYIIKILSSGIYEEVKSVAVTGSLEFSNYLGATINLNQGDFIGVQTSWCKISSNDYSTFFGAFMI